MKSHLYRPASKLDARSFFDPRSKRSIGTDITLYRGRPELSRWRAAISAAMNTVHVMSDRLQSYNGIFQAKLYWRLVAERRLIVMDSSVRGFDTHMVTKGT